MTKDIYLIIRDDADEADICRGDEFEAIRLAVMYDASRVVRMSGDGIWRDCTPDLAATAYADMGPDAVYPTSFIREFDSTMLAAYRECHGNRSAY